MADEFPLPPPEESLGLVEEATRHELARFHAPASLAAAAVLLARGVDTAEHPAVAAAVSRELRLTMSAARGLATPAEIPDSPMDKIRQDAAEGVAVLATFREARQDRAAQDRPS